MDPSHAELARIRRDLDAHGRLFKLDQGGLGADLVQVARGGVRDHFNAEVDPQGQRWPELQGDYQRWKARQFPGEPMGVQTGLMRSELDGPDLPIKPDEAEYEAGLTPRGKAEIEWFSAGDPEQNRKPRPFVDLTPESSSKSDMILDTHFEEGVS